MDGPAQRDRKYFYGLIFRFCDVPPNGTLFAYDNAFLCPYICAGIFINCMPENAFRPRE